MRSLLRKTGLALAGTALALGGAAVAPAEAHAYDPSNARIKAASTNPVAFTICKDWGTTTCSANSLRGSLSAGQNSYTKYGWADTDGFYIGSGYQYQNSCNGGAAWATGPKWVKVPGAIVQPHTCTIYVRRA